MTTDKECQNIYKITLLVSISCVLQITESLIPHPIPGLRLGLANAMTLIALDTLGFGAAMEVAVLRTVLSSCIMGTFLSPSFILSFAGAFLSTLVMGFFYWLSRRARVLKLSLVGISIVGAFCHSMVQLYLAYLLLIRHPGIFIFLPWLCVGSVVMGWFTGILAGRVCVRLQEAESQQLSRVKTGIDCSPAVTNSYLEPGSFLYRMPAEIKIFGVLALSVPILIFKNIWFFTGVYVCLCALIMFSGISLSSVFSRARRYSSLVFTAFMLPVMFNSGTHVVSSIGRLKLTSEGLNEGFLFVSRILFLMLANYLLVKTTPPRVMIKGLTRILSPLRVIGISGKRAARIFSYSLAAIPIFLDKFQAALGDLKLKETKNIKRVPSVITDLIVNLYLTTGFKD